MTKKKEKRKALVIDHIQDDIYTIRCILEGLKFEVVGALGYEEAFARLEEQKFDLVIFEICSQSSYKVASKIHKALPKESKIIFSSLLPEKELLKKCASFCFQKPFEVKEFIKRLSALFPK